MENKSSRKMRKMTIRLYEDDLEFLRGAYPESGYNGTIRALVARHVRRLKNLSKEQSNSSDEQLSVGELTV